MCGVYFCTLCPSVGPKERIGQALDRLPLVSNFLNNFWMQHFDGAHLSPNSVRNAVWHALNEPVCHYLWMRNPHCSTVCIDNSLGPLVRDSSCTIKSTTKYSPPDNGFSSCCYFLLVSDSLVFLSAWLGSHSNKCSVLIFVSCSG